MGRLTKAKSVRQDLLIYKAANQLQKENKELRKALGQILAKVPRSELRSWGIDVELLYELTEVKDV